MSDTSTAIQQFPTLALTVIALLWAGLTASVKYIVAGHAKRVNEKFADVTATQKVQGDKLDGITAAIGEIRLEHANTRAELSERLAKTEAKLPNGQLTSVLQALTTAIGHSNESVVRSPRRRG